jgi:polar amino acid transport system substrate-binding protein
VNGGTGLVRRTRRPLASVARTGAVLLAAAVLTVAAGCAAPSSRPARAPIRPTARAAAAIRAAGSAATGRSTATAACNPMAASLAPSGPPSVTPGSFMAKIRARGYLIAGVDQSTYHFGFLNPLDGNIEGFDIDMIKAVADAIFGNPNKVEYKAISDAQRIPDLVNGSVDIVAHTMTITCARLEQVDFSSVYFVAHQRVLVPDNSPATDGLADLGGQKVCATAKSDSATFIAGYRASVNANPILVTVPYWTDCLVLLQQGQVAAISTDDSILAGLEAQDPFTKIVGPELTNEPYGLAISKQHPDFVRFVNAVLAQERADDAWATSYYHWVGTPVPQPPAAQYARLPGRRGRDGAHQVGHDDPSWGGRWGDARVRSR